MTEDASDKLNAIAEKLEAGEAADVHHLDKLPSLDVINATNLQGKAIRPRGMAYSGLAAHQMRYGFQF